MQARAANTDWIADILDSPARARVAAVVSTGPGTGRRTVPSDWTAVKPPQSGRRTRPPACQTRSVSERPRGPSDHLLDLAVGLMSSLEPREVIQRILDAAVPLLAADRATLSTLTETSGRVEAFSGRDGRTTW